jgi:hypothetical protein
MPTLADWFPEPAALAEPSAVTTGLATLLRDLPHSRSESDATGIIEDFIASQDPASPTAQSIARTIDRLAILMRVKSNAVDEADHALDACLDAFPSLENLDAPDVWARIRPALEHAIPPSILALADCQGKKKTRVSAAPSWCVRRHHARALTASRSLPRSSRSRTNCLTLSPTLITLAH